MISYFLIIGKQGIVILIMVAIGFFCGKKKIFNDSAIIAINNFVLLFVMACTAVTGFQVEFSINKLKDFGAGMLAAIALYIANFFLSMLLFRKKEKNRRNLLSLSVTLTNCGFVAYPMQVALIGSDGIFYGLPYTTIMGFFAWTIGAAYISNDKKESSLKKVITTPGIIGVCVGLIFFLCSIQLPEVIKIAVDDIANMNMPLPMIIIGYYMSKVKLCDTLKNMDIWEASALRLVVFPIAAIVIMYTLGIKGNILLAATIANATPPAAILTMLAAKYHKEVELCSELVSFQTVLSMITMPFIVMIAGMLA